MFLIALLGASCGGKRSEQARGSGESTATRSPAQVVPSADDAAVDERPRALLSPAIGPRDSLMTAIGPRLREWVVLWREAIPEFTVDSLRFAGWSEFRPAADADPWPVPGYVVDSMHDRGDVRNTAALVIPGPGGRYVLLVDRYQMVTEESAGIEIGGEPESAPVLLDRGTGQTRSFEFCGTPCAYHWGAWIDSARFVLGGWSETDSRGLDKYGTLGYYDLRRGLKASYLVPATESGRSAAYYAAWREWLISRYRRLPRS